MFITTEIDYQELHPKRNVIRLMCMKICDYPWHSSITRDHTSETQLTIWNVDEDVVERIREGDRMKVSRQRQTTSYLDISSHSHAEW